MTLRVAGGRSLAVALPAALAAALAAAHPIALPAVLGAQAICSAPHSSPTLAAGGSIGTLAPATGWVMVSTLYQGSSASFNSDGERQSFLAHGRFRSSSLYLSTGAGLVRGVDLWAQLPVHGMRYLDQGGERRRSGVGDLRVALRISPALLRRTLPLALRVGAKIPGSDFPLDATIIPLTEGQRDLEVSLESGHAFHMKGLYVLGWSGVRRRFLNRESDRKPGDERFLHAAMGRQVARLRVEVATDFLTGQAPRQVGLELPTARRRLLQLAPTVVRPLGRGTLEFTAVVPLVGRNLPTGPGFSTGYRREWGRRSPPIPRAKAFDPSP